MSSFAISINVLNGLVAVTKGYDILGDIKAEGGILRRDAIGGLVEEKSWKVSCVDDADARHIAKTLKKRARKCGLKAYSFLLNVNNENKQLSGSACRTSSGLRTTTLQNRKSALSSSTSTASRRDARRKATAAWSPVSCDGELHRACGTLVNDNDPESTDRRCSACVSAGNGKRKAPSPSTYLAFCPASFLFCVALITTT